MLSTAAELQVAVGVLRDGAGRVLLARRRAGSHLGGLWEFPGGKVEDRESPAEALRRELAEELGVQVLAHRPLLTVRHDYGERRVCLRVHEVLRFAGEPRGCEGQPLRWVDCGELGQYAFPRANRAIVERLQGLAGG